MPAVSQAQREKLNAKFGHAWVKAHGFDNKGPLPMYVSASVAGQTAKPKRKKRRGKKGEDGKHHPKHHFTMHNTKHH
jgi:hypothetical protein